MAVPYPTMAVNTTDTFGGMFQYADSVVTHGAAAGVFGFVILVMVFFISFLALTSYPFDKRLLASLFLGFITSLLLSLMRVLDPLFVPALLILTAIAWFLTKED
jgi:hypothetical protein